MKNTKDETKQIAIHYSWAIMWCNFFLSFLIVCLHTNIPETQTLPAGISARWDTIKQVISAIADVAVPCFFTISAYLLFRKFTCTNYAYVVKSRIKTVLVPFLLWSFLGILYQNALHFLRGETYEHFLVAWITGSCNPPIWFLRTLFVYVLMAPVIWKLVSRSQKSVVWIPLLIAANLVIDFDYTSVFYWAPSYLLGAWLAIYQKERIEAEQAPRTLMDLLPIRVIILVGLFGLGACIYNIEKIYNIYRFVSGTAVVYVFWKTQWNRQPRPWMQNSFFTFCSHALLLGLIPKVIFRLVPQNLPGICIGYALSAGTIWLCTVCASLLLKKCLPRFYLLLSGGRTVRS